MNETVKKAICNLRKAGFECWALAEIFGLTRQQVVGFIGAATKRRAAAAV